MPFWHPDIRQSLTSRPTKRLLPIRSLGLEIDRLYDLGAQVEVYNRGELSPITLQPIAGSLARY